MKKFKFSEFGHEAIPRGDVSRLENKKFIKEIRKYLFKDGNRWFAAKEKFKLTPAEATRFWNFNLNNEERNQLVKSK
jgi:hypothetical protein